ncbi:MAG TPA: hypothetical protein VH370_05645 [Humisphaera sp.]|jgi:chromosome segregation ATPase|nr:hypothetical protein [Humisphaera sp.]
MPEKKIKQNIEELRARYQELSNKRIEAGANLKTANQNLEQLKEEARRLWGTDDVPDLEKKLAAMREENERKRVEYQQHLETIEAQLKEVDEKFSKE